MVLYSTSPSTHRGTLQPHREMQPQGLGIPSAPFSGALRLQGLTPNVVSYGVDRSAHEKGQCPQEILPQHQIVGHLGVLRLMQRTRPRGHLIKVTTYNVLISVCKKGRQP